MVRLFLISFSSLLLFSTWSSSLLAREVVAYWGFENRYEFPPTANKLDLAPDVDNTSTADANLQAFLGEAGNLDENGGVGFVSYMSPTSGINYLPTRTLKWDDLRGGGNDFDINGTTTFTVDKKDGNGEVSDEFGNDALIYITLNGLGYRDFELRFDAEGTPGSLPGTFDIFYRVGGSGTWFREFNQDDIVLSFQDYNPVDPENQFADSGIHALASELNNQSQIEIIVNDFDELGNGELEIDNIEITANQVPEPGSILLALVGGLLATNLRSRANRA